MLPLAHSSPRSTAELVDALARGLAAHGTVAEVSCEGEWPELHALRLDIARIDQPRPLAPVEAKETFRIEKVDIAGRPVWIEGIPVALAANFTAVRGGIADGTPPQLVLLGVASGVLSLELSRDHLERGLCSILDRLAQARGAAVKEVQLNLHTPDARVLEFSARVIAKAFIANATLTVRGRIEIDGELCVHIRELALSGEGMLASLAQSLLGPHVAQWRGRTIRLADYVVAGVRMQDVHLVAGETLKLTASCAAS
jgi:hypothetical protein